MKKIFKSLFYGFFIIFAIAGLIIGEIALLRYLESIFGFFWSIFSMVCFFAVVVSIIIYFYYEG